MNTKQADSQQEYELQELYILSQHWLQDISFMEDEMRFFKNILRKYQEAGLLNEMPCKATGFITKIQEQEQRLDFLKIKIPEFLHFLKPFIDNSKTEMDFAFLEKYNKLEAQLKTLFAEVKTTKKELFAYTEAIMTTEKAEQNQWSSIHLYEHDRRTDRFFRTVVQKDDGKSIIPAVIVVTSMDLEISVISCFLWLALLY